MNDLMNILTDQLRDMPSGGVFALLLVLLVVGGGLCVGLITQLAGIWSKHKKTEMVLQLKSEMVARGMSVSEIERVLGAGTPEAKQ
jgi:hypothetical protein